MLQFLQYLAVAAKTQYVGFFLDLKWLDLGGLFISSVKIINAAGNLIFIWISIANPIFNSTYSSIKLSRKLSYSYVHLNNHCTVYT